MKWLFIVAVLLNVAFFVYNSFFEKPVVNQTDTKKGQEKNQIILLNELDASELKTLQSKVLAVKPGLKKESSFEPFAESSEKDQTQTAMLGDTDSRSEKVLSGAIGVDGVLCYDLGPLSKKVLDDIRITLEKAYQNNLSFRIETTSETTYYRIYIPPVVNREVRNDTLALLDKHGLEDNYVMSIDGRKNAIALGVFKKRSAAETIAAKADKLGLSTTIEAISDDKNSLYKLQLVFQKNLDMKPFNDELDKNQLELLKCEK